ncbi:Pre-mRNA-splicing factor cwc24 [Neolecta irregularis DAH-3]|uniref:Pre-mRNA-splicing factor CWC24 n=1 Tax=Neolecta irregularis (strain DAH-3) TaxID=1198029 RepID=A0A1U7LWN1_NEOID|nr:Pre-mRNA-splicing factor cwc24 [Neolecta irregularis DAH-3]|eukprot:OLL27044.1 Pre-mRNA-splicing factor cwc24 [Neolecta irregularis DAH-3]
MPDYLFKSRSKSKNIRKRPADRPLSSSDSEPEETAASSRLQKNTSAIRSSKIPKSIVSEVDVTYASARSSRNTNINDVAREIETKPDKPVANPVNDQFYHGAENYKKHITPRESGAVGPVKAPQNIRQITIIDYQPDVCKDYKETGYCGYGDSCKFLHDRGDYKAGWQLDREWETVQRRDQTSTKPPASDVDSEEDLPFVCLICRCEYSSPIVTKCGHFFCEACAIKRYKKNPSCLVCGAGTMGIFHPAKKLEGKIKEKKEREEKEAEVENEVDS